MIHLPVVAHIIAAVERFLRRLGSQFAAGVAFYSVLSVVPVVMFAVSMIGMTLTVLRPDLLNTVSHALTQHLNNDEVARSLHKIIHDGLFNWRGLAITAFLTAAYAGTRWVLHLKMAVRVMWWDRFGDAARSRSFLTDLVWNFFIFLGLLAGILLAFAITTAGGTFSEQVLRWLGLENLGFNRVLLRLVSIGLVLLSSWLLVAFLMIVLPGKRTSKRIFVIATGIGALALTLLQQAAGLIIELLSHNLSATLFGSVITVMYMFYLVGFILLLVAAWVGTAETWPEWLSRREVAEENMAPQEDDINDQLEDDGDGNQGAEQESRLDQLRRERWAAWKPMSSLDAANYDPDSPPVLTGGRPIPEDVAARGVRTGMRVGWGVGVATGAGIGAVVTAVWSRWTRRRPR